jgi:hypothetical protein
VLHAPEHTAIAPNKLEQLHRLDRDKWREFLRDERRWPRKAVLQAGILARGGDTPLAEQALGSAGDQPGLHFLQKADQP